MRHAPNIAAAFAALHGTEYDTLTPRGPRNPAFVTISRQAGAGGRSVATELARVLNDRDPHADVQWTVWDHELVDRVAEQYHLPPHRVAALEDERPNWLETALGGLTVTGGADELTVFHRVMATIRALADVGKVIIVGRGAAFLTADMPGGVHVRLVAPADKRVEWTAARTGSSPAVAADWVRQTDAARDAYYRRHFPGRPLIPEAFHATFNTALAPTDHVARAIATLLPAPVPVGADVAAT